MPNHSSKRTHSEDRPGRPSQRRSDAPPASSSSSSANATAPAPKRPQLNVNPNTQPYSTVTVPRVNQSSYPPNAPVQYNCPYMGPSYRAPAPSGSQLSGTTTSTAAPREITNQFIRQTRISTQQPEYTAIANRGALLQSKRGGIAYSTPNRFGYLTDGTLEPTAPTTAPIAKWTLANQNGELKLAQTFRLGIIPTYIEAYRRKGQVTLYYSLNNVRPEQAVIDPNGPISMDTSHSPSDSARTAHFFEHLPLEIPEDQAHYKPSMRNLLMATGQLTEDKRSSVYWQRPSSSCNKNIQVGFDPMQATATSSTLNARTPEELAVDWDNLVLTAPATWFSAGTEINLLQPILDIFLSAQFDLKAQLVVACKATYFYRNVHSITGRLRIDHDNVNLKNRLNRFAKAIHSAALDINRIRLARNETFRQIREIMRTNQTDQYNQSAAQKLEADYYYRNLQVIHRTILMMPSSSALLFGIPYLIKTSSGTAQLFKPIVLGYFMGTALCNRSRLLALFAREEPRLEIVAEDDLGKTIYGPDGAALTQQPASNTDFAKYQELQSRWNKVRDRTSSILRGEDIPNPAGATTAAQATILPDPLDPVSAEILEISDDDGPSASSTASTCPGPSTSSASTSSVIHAKNPAVKRTVAMSTSRQRTTSSSSSRHSTDSRKSAQVNKPRTEPPPIAAQPTIMTMNEQRLAIVKVVPAPKPPKHPEWNVPKGPTKFNFYVKPTHVHSPDNMPLVWDEEQERIRVIRTQWDFTKSEEIAYDTPFNILKDMVIATGGWILQRAVVATSRTQRGQVLLTHEMDLPGIKESIYSPGVKASNLEKHGLEDLRPITAPITFIVGSWEGKLLIPPEALPRGISVEMEEIYNKIRSDMEATRQNAKREKKSKEEKSRAKGEHRRDVRLGIVKPEPMSPSHCSKVASKKKPGSSSNSNSSNSQEALNATLSKYVLDAELEEYFTADENAQVPSAHNDQDADMLDENDNELNDTVRVGRKGNLSSGHLLTATTTFGSNDTAMETNTPESATPLSFISTGSSRTTSSSQAPPPRQVIPDSPASPPSDQDQVTLLLSRHLGSDYIEKLTSDLQLSSPTVIKQSQDLPGATPLVPSADTVTHQYSTRSSTQKSPAKPAWPPVFLDSSTTAQKSSYSIEDESFFNSIHNVFFPPEDPHEQEATRLRQVIAASKAAQSASFREFTLPPEIVQRGMTVTTSVLIPEASATLADPQLPSQEVDLNNNEPAIDSQLGKPSSDHALSPHDTDLLDEDF